MVEDTTFKPAFDEFFHPIWRSTFLQDGGVGDVIKTASNVYVQHIFGLAEDRSKDG